MKRQFSIYGALAAFILFLGVLTGCEADDTPGGSSSGEVVPVTISLQMDEVDQLTKAVDEDAINTLDVYIYNGSTVEKHLTKDNFGDDLQAETTLSEGQKTIYAIANAGDSYRETAPANTAVNAFSWLDVQSDAYMPMSTTEDTTWMVSSSQSEYKVRLNRMVAKMNVKIVDERADKAEEVGDITIAKLLLTQTPLYRSEYGVVALPGDGDDWTGNSMNDNEYFYLHENSGTFPVSVKVGNDTREGSFTKTIPRNHIFPLVIHLTDYSLQIDITYHLEAIGTITEHQSASYNNEVLLPEGCTYEITVTPKKNMTGGWNDGATWTWRGPEFELSNSSITFDGTPSWPIDNPLEASSTFTFTGKISALCQENDKVEFLITLNDKTVIKDCPLVITTRPLGNNELTNTRSYSVSAETEAVHIDL
ncbi:MAG TPA: hypothetical protein H9984_06805 [Candidatus Parabacteroides faecavium]|nr:hypothetical protein [Candidatus Parabacteroides faecavium]